MRTLLEKQLRDEGLPFALIFFVFVAPLMTLLWWVIRRAEVRFHRRAERWVNEVIAEETKEGHWYHVIVTYDPLDDFFGTYRVSVSKTSEGGVSE